MTTLQNSAFKVKTGSVPDVSLIIPEPGAFTISEHDGNLYYADMFGWHQAEQPYSYTNVFVQFNGTDQLVVKFKAPSTETVTIYWGDGTTTDVVGQDDTLITETSAYGAAGTYRFNIGAGAETITHLDLSGQPVSGSIAGFGEVNSLVYVDVSNTRLYGDVGNLSELSDIETFIASESLVFGDISGLEGNTTIKHVDVTGLRGIHGDISAEPGSTNIETLLLSGTAITFTNIVSWVKDNITVDISSCGLDHVSIDKAIHAFSTCTNSAFDVAGENENRTYDTNADLTTLWANGSEIELNDVYGDDIVVNGGFDTDLSGWVNSDGAWSWDAGTALCDGTGASRFYQNILEVGKNYLIVFDLPNYVKATLKFHPGGGSEPAVINATSAGQHKAVFEAANFYAYFTDADIFVGNMDNVSIKEVTFSTQKL